MGKVYHGKYNSETINQTCQLYARSRTNAFVKHQNHAHHHQAIVYMFLVRLIWGQGQFKWRRTQKRVGQEDPFPCHSW